MRSWSIQGSNYTAPVGISGPLFEGFSRQYDLRAAEASADVARARANVLQQQVTYQVFTSYYDLQTATQRVRTSDDLLASATQSEAVALGRYREGVGSVRFTGPAVRLTDSHHVRISRIGEVKTYESTRKLYRHLDRGTGRIVSATVRCKNARWQIAFTCEIERTVAVTRPPERVIGIDVDDYTKGAVTKTGLATLAAKIAAWGPLATEGEWVWRWKDRIDRRWIATFAGQV